MSGAVLDKRIRENVYAMFKVNRYWIGDMENEVLEPGFVRNTAIVPDQARNTHGFAFGGYLIGLVDCTACGAPWTLGKRVVTQTMDTHFLRSAKVGDRIVVEARSVHCGRSSAVAEVRMTSADDPAHVLLTSTVTMHITGPVVDVPEQ